MPPEVQSARQTFIALRACHKAVGLARVMLYRHLPIKQQDVVPPDKLEKLAAWEELDWRIARLLHRRRIRENLVFHALVTVAVLLFAAVTSMWLWEREAARLFLR